MTLLFPLDTKINDTFGHQIYHHRVFFNHGGSDEMYVGGADVLLKIDVDDYHVIEVGVLERFFIF